MRNGTTIVGLDAHAQAIQVAMLLPGSAKAVEWKVANEAGAIRRLAKKILRAAPGEVRACYEAGPTGYALQRQLQEGGAWCDVVAPSLIPVKPGDRVKTDRRDARKLAELLRAGLLTVVRPPTPEEEAVRDLCRAREDVQRDLTRCRHRLGKLLLRRGIRRGGGARAWTRAHRAWLRGLRFELAVDQVVFEDYLLAVEQLEERVRALDEKLEELAGTEPYREPVGWLRCFRGIDTVTAMTLVTELHGFGRFQSPRQLMGYLGLTPSEASSGGTTRRGGITKTGNAHVRRVLVEAAWHYRHRPAVSAKLRKRRHGQPARVVALADKAQHRLHRRHARLLLRGKPQCKVVVALARELAGFVWATLQGRELPATA